MTPFPLLAAVAVKKGIEVLRARSGYKIPTEDNLEIGGGGNVDNKKHQNIWLGADVTATNDEKANHEVAASDSCQPLMAKESPDSSVAASSGCPVLPIKL